MQSIRSRLLIWILRNRHLLKFSLKPEVVDESFSVDAFRNKIDTFSRRMKLPKNITARKQDIEGINAEWVEPENAIDGKVLLYIHGGGFISGSCLTHRTHVAKFARNTGFKSLVFDYRLAPEHPFPAALDDCVAIYSWLLKNGYQGEDIVVGGESAGGTLVLSLLLALKRNKIALPKAVFSISPATDLRVMADSFRRNAKRDIAPLGSWEIWTRFYIGDNDPLLPLLSPVMGDFHNMPPVYLCVGTHEIHLDDCRNMAERIRTHGSEVTIKEWPKMVHAFPLLAPLFPEAKKAMDEICSFVKRSVGCH